MGSNDGHNDDHSTGNVNVFALSLAISAKEGQSSLSLTSPCASSDGYDSGSGSSYSSDTGNTGYSSDTGFSAGSGSGSGSNLTPEPSDTTPTFTGYGPGSSESGGAWIPWTAAKEFCQAKGLFLPTAEQAIQYGDLFNAARQGHCCFWLDEKVVQPFSGIADPKFSDKISEWSAFATSVGTTLQPDTRQNQYAVEDPPSTDMCLSAEDFNTHVRFRLCGRSRNTICTNVHTPPTKPGTTYAEYCRKYFMSLTNYYVPCPWAHPTNPTRLLLERNLQRDRKVCTEAMARLYLVFGGEAAGRMPRR